MKNLLITGINGFVGQHLVNEFSSNGYSINGVGGRTGNKIGLKDLNKYIELDLTSLNDIKKIDYSKIDIVVHLAGLAAVGPSFDNPNKYINVNMGIEINLFEEAIRQDKKPKFLIISSGSLYSPSSKLPLTEDSVVAPNSPYAVSKLGQEQLGNYYGLRGFNITVARPFNHFGPGQGQGFIVPDLANQIIEVKKGRKSEVQVGNLDAKRDYTDVRDIVKAYRLLVEKGRSGEIYNVCSGTSHSGHEILNGLTKAAECNPIVKIDPEKIRPSDTLDIFGSYEKLNNDTGWTPEIDFNTTLKDVIDSIG